MDVHNILPSLKNIYLFCVRTRCVQELEEQGEVRSPGIGLTGSCELTVGFRS